MKKNFVYVGLGIALLGWGITIGLYLGSRRSDSHHSAGATLANDSAKETGKSAKPAKPAVERREPPPEPKLTPAEIAERASKAVVVLENFDENGERAGQGSGFVSSSDGTILTNYHVIRGAARVVVRTSGSDRYEPERVLAFDPERDIAAVKINGANLPVLPAEHSEAVKTGEHVVAIGAPLGLENTLSDGLISGIRELGPVRIYQTSTPISPGSSGGPLFNDYGRVVALTVASVREGQLLNFAVPIKYVGGMLTSQTPMTFSEMLDRTRVRHAVVGSSFSVPAGQSRAFPVTAPSQGARLNGTFSIAGGFGNDINVAVLSAPGNPIWQGGRVKASGEISLRLKPGSYAVLFDNRFSAISSKSVSGDIHLDYFR